MLLLGAAFGCASNVVGGGTSSGNEGGGGSGGSGGQGGQGGCTEYAGDGCTPGESNSCPVLTGTGSSGFIGGGSTVCELVPGKPCTTQWNGECYTPLVLSFDGAPVAYLADREHGFDLGGNHSQATDWPTARTPWLALDRNGNGQIDDGSELFGSMTVLAGGARAPNGFAALRELDADGDGRITPADPGFASLVLWTDADGDRRTSGGELTTLGARELLSIDLAFAVDPRCDARGNCEVERAAFRYRDAAGVERTGAIIDVHLAPQP